MSDVERLTFNNHQRVRFAEEVSRKRAAEDEALRQMQKEFSALVRRRKWKHAGAVVCNMLAGWLCGLTGYCLATAVTGPAAPLLFLLTVLAFVGGMALDEEEW